MAIQLSPATIRPGELASLDLALIFVDTYIGRFGRYIINNVSGIIWYFVGFPLKILYFNGPSALGFGFWEGKSGEDICSQLTNVDSAFWVIGEDHQSACRDILDRRFNGFALAIGVVIYFVMLVYMIKSCLSICISRAKKRKKRTESE